MFADYVERGLKAGLVAGVTFGAFVALVGNPLVTYAETFEHGHGGGAVSSGVAGAAVSVAGGVVLGVLFGVAVFGAGYYFLEPAVPGAADTKSYALGFAGFVTASGAPWVLLPPQPPGVEQALPTDVRVTWYALMMGTGALACGLSGYAYTRLRAQYGRALALTGAVVSLGVIPAVAAVGPANPVSGPVPDGLAHAFRSVTVAGQCGVWFVLASAHVWFLRRDRDDEWSDREPTASTNAHDSVSAD